MFALLDYKRLPDLPDVPALGEEVPNYVRIPAGVFLYGPAGLPPTLTRRIHAEGVKALNATDVAARMKDLAYLPLGTSPDELASRQVGVLEVIARAVKAAGLEPQ